MEIKDIILNAFAEDIGDGDHSALACIKAEETATARLLVKDEGVLAGMEIAELALKTFDPTLSFNPLMKNGDRIKKGDVAFTASGSARSLLTAERVMLNILQRMCGIATITDQVVQKLSGTNCKVLDTRKTVPGLRTLDKLAVLQGGGTNHRIGLYDMIMIKDNHADYSGGIEMAINRTHDYLKETGKSLKIEIETRNLAEVEEVLRIGGVDRIMLDNFSFEDMREAVKRINGRFETEASGGITLENCREYAETGVDFISMGCLTHSVKNLDLSFKAVKH